MNQKYGQFEGKLNAIPKDELPLETHHVDHLDPMQLTTKMY